VRFVVLGTAQPGGSKRAFRHNRTGRVMVTDANRNAKPWQAIVAATGHEAMNGRRPFDMALEVTFTFYRQRPAGHFGTGRNHGELRDAAPVYPITRPDALKLSRAAEDALTGICWRDDSQIVDEHLHKRYGAPPRMVVEITRTSSSRSWRAPGRSGPHGT
jgi:Holliday junction resolvase RusA-like endonuclease